MTAYCVLYCSIVMTKKAYFKHMIFIYLRIFILKMFQTSFFPLFFVTYIHYTFIIKEESAIEECG